MSGLLLDSHAFLWFIDKDDKISDTARTAIADEDEAVFVSAATVWEITTKHRIGKLPGAAAVAADVARTIVQHGFEPLPISMAHAQRAGAMIGAHRDPFDRMLIAQALLEGLVLVSNETVFDQFGVKRLW